MTAAAQSIESSTIALPQGGLVFKLMGLAIVTIFPALTWLAIVAGAGHAAGYDFAATSLALTGAAIGLFLAAVCAPLMLKPSV